MVRPLFLRPVGFLFMQRHRAVLVAGLFTVSLVLPDFCLPAAAIVIDDFRVGGITVARDGATAATAEQSGLDPAHVLGAARTFNVGNFGSAPQTLIIDNSQGTCSFSTGDTYGYFGLIYGSAGDPLSVNLLAGGGTTFAVDHRSTLASAPNVTLYVTAGGMTQGISLASSQVEHQPLSDGFARATIPFSLFPPEIDFTHIDQLHLATGRFPPFNSVTLRNLVTIPEPATLLLGTLTTACCCGIRCRFATR